jgi:hypothetical protein
MKLFETILAVIAIIIAIYNFDLDSFNRCIVSVLLFMTGILTLSRNEKLNRILRNLAVALAIFLIMKILITG